MSTPEQRRQMAEAIKNFEARRDKKGRLAVYALPSADGGGRYEVAGINERYNKEAADKLAAMINAGLYDEAEALATEYIAGNTDTAGKWSRIPAVESYLRDTAFNRGIAGCARILQRALGVTVDGGVGDETREALATAEQDGPALLTKLRAAREQYERDVVGVRPIFWKGLTNRWNNALAIAKRFPLSVNGEATTSVEPVSSAEPAVIVTPAINNPCMPSTMPEVLPALRVGATGTRVSAWQSFLRGQGFDPGVIDGDFGEHTRAATMEFQQKYELEEDGIAGRQTLLKAMSLGFELIEEPGPDKANSNYPPRPSFPPLTSNAQREALWGRFDYVSSPTADNPEAIRILGDWESANVVRVPIPQLRQALGRKAPEVMRFHRNAAEQLQGLWAAWESEGLLDRVLTYEGAFVPRFVRGSRTTLSNHAFGSAFDINYSWNMLGARPAMTGQKGSVRELVAIANTWGFFWGGHYNGRKDGMHFEIAFIKK